MTPSRQPMPNRRRQILEDGTPAGEPFHPDVYSHLGGHRDDTWVTSLIARLTQFLRKIGGSER